MVVYVLYSALLDSYYVGQSQDISTRLAWHIDKVFVRNFTKRAADWVLFLLIECKSRKQAVDIELHIKRMKSRKYLENLKRYPEIIERLKTEYQ